jgi:hypothetical protein
MNTTSSKFLLGRAVVHFLILVLVLVGFDHITGPSEETRIAVLDAMNKKVLDPAALVDVNSSINFASFIAVLLRIVGLMVLFLWCSDLWILWQSRRTPNT